jgi:hypothetical protein
MGGNAEAGAKRRQVGKAAALLVSWRVLLKG